MQPGQPHKQGLSALGIVLIAIGALAVIGIGTCAAAVFFVSREAEKIANEGGIVVVAPAEVKAQLAGPKKDYVGHWESAKGSTLDIDADGNLKLVIDEGGSKETLEMPIAAFAGDDIEIKMLVTLTIPISEPPRPTATGWTMTAKGVRFER